VAWSWTMTAATGLPDEASAESTTDPRVEQVAQLALDHLVAQLAAVAEQDGRTVEQLVLDHLAGRTGETAAEQDGHTRATHEDAKIIAFRPRSARTQENPSSDAVQTGVSLSPCRIRTDDLRITRPRAIVLCGAWSCRLVTFCLIRGRTAG